MPRFMVLGGFLRESEVLLERGGEGSRLSRHPGEGGAGPLELIGLDKEWGGWVGGADINFTNSCPLPQSS